MKLSNITASCLMMLALAAHADVINVPADQPTIQGAVNIAVDGDEIVLAPGTYTEQVNLLGKEVTIRSADPDDPAVVAATIVDGGNDQDLPGFPQDEGPVFRANSGETINTRLIGLTITGGAADDPTLGLNGTSGGGVQAFFESALTIDRCVFIDNWAAGNGGAVYAGFGGQVIITNCAFTDNETGGRGGAVYIGFSDDPVITNCTFVGNASATGGGAVFLQSVGTDFIGCIFRNNTTDGFAGGAVSASSSSSDPRATTFVSCIFEDNANTGGSGGAVSVSRGTVMFDTCEFRRNSALERGGGAEVLSADFTTVNACMFEDNTANDGAGLLINQSTTVVITDTQLIRNQASDEAGGLFIFGGDATITNSTFAENSADDSSGALSLGGTSSHHVLRDCDFDGNTSGVGGSGAASMNFSRFEVIDCTFTNNSTAGSSGAIFMAFPSVNSQISGCLFADNTASIDAGAASISTPDTIPFSTDTVLFITETDFYRNTAGDRSGAMQMNSCVLTEVTDCRFVDNEATTSGGAVSIFFTENNGPAPTTFTNTLFHNNSAGTFGGAVYAFVSVDRFVNCLFTLNTASQGGVAFSGCASPVFTNCTAWGNNATDLGGVLASVCSDGVNIARVSNNIWFGNTAGNGAPNAIAGPNSTIDIGFSLVENGALSNGGGSFVIRPGNISGDPLFADANGQDNDPLTADDNDLTLVSGSPAIDAGDNSEFSASVALDFAGSGRFVDDAGTPDTGVGPAPVIDLGAFEFQGGICQADLSMDGLLNNTDINLFVSAFLAQDIVADLNADSLFNNTDINLFVAAFLAGCP